MIIAMYSSTFTFHHPLADDTEQESVLVAAQSSHAPLVAKGLDKCSIQAT